MQLRYIEDLAQGQETPLLAIAVADGASATEAYLSAIDSVLRGGVEAVMTAGDVTGKSSDEVVLYGQAEGPRRVVLLGVGKADDLDAEKLRRFAGRAVRVAERLKLEALTISLEGMDGVDAEVAAQAVAEGAGLAAWKFTELQAEDEESPTVLVKCGRSGRWGHSCVLSGRDGRSRDRPCGQLLPFVAGSARERRDSNAPRRRGGAHVQRDGARRHDL